MLDRPQADVVRARGDYVSGLHGGDPCYELDGFLHCASHVAGIVILANVAVDPQFDVQVLGIVYLVCCDDDGPQRAECVPGLSPKEAAATVGIYSSGGYVHEVQVPEDVGGGLLCGHVGRCLANHEAELGFVVEVGYWGVWEFDGIAVADDCAGGFQECLPVGGEGQFSALQVVSGHACDSRWLGQGRSKPNGGGWNAFRAVHCALDASSVVVESVDQPPHPRLGVHMWDVSDRVGHIHYVAAL